MLGALVYELSKRTWKSSLDEHTRAKQWMFRGTVALFAVYKRQSLDVVHQNFGVENHGVHSLWKRAMEARELGGKVAELGLTRLAEWGTSKARSSPRLHKLMAKTGAAGVRRGRILSRCLNFAEPVQGT